MVDKVPAKVAAKAASKRKAAEEAAAAGGSILPPPAKSPALGVGSSPRAEAASLQLALTVAGDSSDHSGALVPAAPERKGNKYRGVYVDKQADNKWKASIRLNHKELHLGYYDSEELAARAYDKANICVKGVPKNLKHPGAFSDADIEVIKSFDGDVEKLRRWMGVGYDAKRCTSAHRGVCKEKKTGKWRAEIQRRGKKESLGYHELEEDAVRAYDRACIVINGDAAKTNRPASEYEAERALLRAFTFEQYQATLQTKARRQAKHTSDFRGVRKHEHKQKNGELSVKWRAEITRDGKKVSLGYHDDEEAAARAYDDARIKQCADAGKACNPDWLNFPMALPAPPANARRDAPPALPAAPANGAANAAAAAARGESGAATGDGAGDAATGRAAGDAGGGGSGRAHAKAAAPSLRAGKSLGGVKGKKVAAAAAAAAVETGSFLASLAE
mgnify:CR=1 FL=1